MQTYSAQVSWQREDQPFLDKRYSRAHAWQFDGGLRVPASSSPLSVRVPLSDPAAVDPEEALVASVSSCHMLLFLSIAARQGLLVDSYVDEASGILDTNAEGRKAMTLITLRPKVAFSGERQPDEAELDAIHHEAHGECYIANSIKTDVVIEKGV